MATEIKFSLSNAVFKILEYIWHVILRGFYGESKHKLPQVSDEILLQSASSLAWKIVSRKIKSENVLLAFIRRIEEVNPIINALVDERFEDALKEARAVDLYLENSNLSSDDILRDKPLMGVPFTTKNSIGVKGLIQDCALHYVKGRIAEKDCEAVQLMRNAGAIPLLVSNIPEMCMWMDSSNTIYGRTNNPYDLTKVPGGSSGGEGALIGSAASVIGVGTDIGGSVRIPSYCCGIFGHKPTKKIVSNEGHFPSSYLTELDNFKVTGPMCRYAEDLRVMLKVLATKNIERLKLDKKVDVRKIKFYYVTEFSSQNLISGISDEMVSGVKQVVNYLNSTCEVSAQEVSFPGTQSIHGSIFIAKLNEVSNSDVFQVASGVPQEKFSFILEFVKFALRMKNHHTLYILLYLLFRKLAQSSTDIFQINNERIKQLDSYLKNILEEDGVLIFPPQPQPHYYHQETFFKGKGSCYTSIFNILGYPSTQCPIGLSSEKLPMGVQIISYINNDHLTIAVAEELQKAFGGWVCP